MKTKAQTLMISLIAYFILCISCQKLDPVPLTKFSTLADVSNIGYNSATVKATFIDVGEGAVSYGHCWATTTNPTLDDFKTTNSGSPKKQIEFISNLSGLRAGTKYYIRAYVSTNESTTYSNEISFTSLACADNDGNNYNTVTIGTQVWMKENLKTTKYNEGSNMIYPGTDNNAWTNNTIGAYCWYNNDIANKATYGALYNWYAVNTGKLCPSGWHVPTDAEWTTLITYLGGDNIAGGKLKETGTTHWGSPNTGASNLSDYMALPGGCRGGDGIFWVVGQYGNWWSSSIYSDSIAWSRAIGYIGTQVFRDSVANKGSGYAIRCILGASTQINLPNVSTSPVSNINQNTATSGGNVTSNGGGTITTRGVCWGTTSKPTIALSTKTNDGNGSGIFISNITGLTSGTKYYVRAYASNSAGTAYGSEISFTTPSTVVIPTVSTAGLTCKTYTTYESGGNVTSNGGAAVTARGVCWSTSPSPTVALSTKTSDGTGTGTFSSSITGLTLYAYYYVRAYATNSAGTAYGNEFSFCTPAVVDVDGNAYNAVNLGTQVWIKENLKTTKYKDNTSISYPGTDNTAWQNNTTGAYAWYNNDIANKATYGALYNWHAVNTGKLCPTGWHVPTDAEWTTLENYLIANGYNYDGTTTGNKIAKAMASTTLWTTSTNTGAVGNADYPAYRNKSGFTALPGGSRYDSGTFDNIGTNNNWWSSMEYDATSAWYRFLSFYYSNVYRNYNLKNNGFSVRCLRD
jgi:uncharacterized protein (TIGR02145 family)